MNPKILFMGTPEFAVPSLKALLSAGRPIIGVVTQPDRPSGRGKRPTPPPVGVFAAAHRLPIFQPERLRNPEFHEQFRMLAPDLVVVVAFGQILPKAMLELPPLGCINVHPSLLPKYRGAAPMHWAIIRGESRTGITIMQMDEGMDSGDILLQRETPIGSGETAGELHDRLAVQGAGMLMEAIEMIEKGSIRRTPQDHAAATYAPRLGREDGRIRWSADARDIVRLIRGLSPSPCAYTGYNGKMFKIYRALETQDALPAPPGTIALSDNRLLVRAGSGSVLLLDVQLQDRNRMSAELFLRGFRFRPGDRLA